MTSLVEEKRKWTYNDYLDLNDDKRYEIIKGRLEMVPAPNFNHQLVLSELGFLLKKHVEEKGLGYIVYAPTDVILGEDNVVQPDILFISLENNGIIKEKGVFGPPDMVVEILSPSTQYKDIYEKKDLYENSKVKEFWIVNPYMKSIEVMALNKNDVYELFSEGYLEEGKKTIQSDVINGLEVRLEAVFKPIHR